MRGNRRVAPLGVCLLSLALLATGCQSDGTASAPEDRPTSARTVERTSSSTTAQRTSRPTPTFAGAPLAMLQEEIAMCRALGLDPIEVARLRQLPLYQMNEAQVHKFLRFLHAVEPDLRTRIGILARKNLGQPYNIYLLGEAPFETFDPQPLYSLRESDCVVFAEHTLAMGLGGDWTRFFGMLQRIRYRDGQIGVATRNHYTESDWVPANAWLYTDVTDDLGGDAVVRFEQRVDRARFLKNTFGLETDILVQQHVDTYLPFSETGRAIPELQTGDLALIVRGTSPTDVYVGHVTMVIRTEDDAINLIHSARPVVREESIQGYIQSELRRADRRRAEGKAYFQGFKFLRLNDNPLERLVELDGPDAPSIKLPLGALVRTIPDVPVLEQPE
ncbi:N-acetylmuramoyl-L-alanine amidase-like domain-containing protein [Mucisphaera sp.]|uniref:N-acetylmuramoyl-L-alanine amidase-like domain-containing protein n=1 Tax=Mucisphaera sp. TaxID=2913024 RepID=UPI003D0FC7D1